MTLLVWLRFWLPVTLSRALVKEERARLDFRYSVLTYYYMVTLRRKRAVFQRLVRQLRSRAFAPLYRVTAPFFYSRTMYKYRPRRLRTQRLFLRRYFLKRQSWVWATFPISRGFDRVFYHYRFVQLDLAATAGVFLTKPDWVFVSHFITQRFWTRALLREFASHFRFAA